MMVIIIIIINPRGLETSALVDNLLSDGATMKILVGGNLKTQAKFKMKTRIKTKCCIGRRADKSGPCLSVKNQAEVEKYVTGTNSFPEYSSEQQNRENPNLGPLDPPSHKNISKVKRIKWTREEYKEVMTAFYQALKEPKDNTAKQTYELWRQKVGEHRSYIDANKLANVRLIIIEIKNQRLTAAEKRSK